MAGLDKDIWIIANWKSNKTISEALDWVSIVGPQIPKKDNLKIVVCPAFSVLSELKKAITVGAYPIMLGSQDLSPFEQGAYTGEESASLIKQFVDLAILGHSERRKNFAETDDMVEKKFKQALENNITPLVCIQSEETPIPQNCNMVAYEPIWAISTGLVNTPGVGKADTPEDANKVAKAIRQKYGNNLEVIYGGSVNSQNVKGFITQGDIGGVLVGNASLNPEEFVRICNLM
ncbi:triosephosphate isomerase [Candidatus Daviesbacteria bacterium]|nr:triosephosphate isomerase [Candidatus Daviesbacteria bacterium]